MTADESSGPSTLVSILERCEPHPCAVLDPPLREGRGGRRRLSDIQSRTILGVLPRARVASMAASSYRGVPFGGGRWHGHTIPAHVVPTTVSSANAALSV